VTFLVLQLIFISISNDDYRLDFAGEERLLHKEDSLYNKHSLT
jgi:hypothetical protein